MISLITFILFVFVSSVIVNGWYLITRKGRIFGVWEEFWEQYTQAEDTDPPVFKFSHWIRYPISACPMCMSSIYGTIIFLITIFVFKNSELLSYSTIQILLIWVAYELCLTCSNDFVHEKLK